MGNNTRVSFAIPGDIAARTGGYGYDRKILALLPQAGMAVTYIPLPDGFPAPSPAEMAQTAQSLEKAPQDALLMIDGLAFGALPADMLAGLRTRLVALVHHPLGLETGLSEDQRARLIASETRALIYARHCIVTSATTARLVTRELGFPADYVTVAEPGTDPAPRARGGGYPATLFAAGSIIPRKGYDVLIASLARLRDLDWQLVIAGSPLRAPETAHALDRQIAELGLASRVTMLGDLSETDLNTAYDRADIFVMSSHFEGYGMVLAEAMARGLPIVMTRAGAAAETVPEAVALKTLPGDVAALAAALRRMITDASLRRDCADASWAAGQVLPRWEDTARIVADALRAVAAR